MSKIGPLRQDSMDNTWFMFSLGRQHQYPRRDWIRRFTWWPCITGYIWMKQASWYKFLRITSQLSGMHKEWTKLKWCVNGIIYSKSLKVFFFFSVYNDFSIKLELFRNPVRRKTYIYSKIYEILIYIFQNPTCWINYIY